MRRWIGSFPQVHVQIVPVPFQTMGRTILKDHFFIKYVGVLCGYYFLYMQFFLSIPLRAVQIAVLAVLALIRLERQEKGGMLQYE